MPPRAEGEGVEPPRPEGPPVFETGYRTGGSPSESGPGRRRTCNPPVKSRELCRVELRSHECDRQESNLRRPAFQAGALPAELRPQGTGDVEPIEVSSRRQPSRTYGRRSGRGWDRTSDLLFVRQALVPSELLAREIRDKESNLDLQVQSLASCRLDDPGACCGRRAPGRAGARRDSPVHASAWRWSRRKVVSVYVSSRSCRDDVFQATRPTLQPWIDTPTLREPSCRPSWRSFGARCVRRSSKKALVNQGAISASPFLRESARDLISLRRGLDSN